MTQLQALFFHCPCNSLCASTHWDKNIHICLRNNPKIKMKYCIILLMLLVTHLSFSLNTSEQSSVVLKSMDDFDYKPSLNKTIYVYWSQGMDRAPFLVQTCYESWKRFNNDWNIVFIDNSSLDQIAPDIKRFQTDSGLRSSLPHQSFSDILRLYLLTKFGGVWADSTTLCLRPLNDWIYAAVRPAGFFLYQRKDHPSGISSWFIASEANNILATAWYNGCVTYMDNPSDLIYHWVHREFKRLIKSHSELLNIFNKMPKMDASLGESSEHLLPSLI